MILDWPACRNARDLGGLPTLDGGRIRDGALLRSDHHAAMTPADVATVRAAGVSRIVDLRRPAELAEQPSPFAGDPIYTHVSMLMDVTDYEYPADSYGPLLDHNQGRVAAAFRAIAEAPPGGVLVHCRGGRDRTGTLVALALTVAGVGPEVVAEDYARSENCPATTMINTLAHAERAYGGVENYLRGIGVEPHHLDAVRERLREPAFLTETRAGWDAVADWYTEQFRGELAAKIWDRALLAGFAELVSVAPGPVVEVGSGPGATTEFLHGLGVDVSGIDLSPGMVAVARRDHPEIRFQVGSMTDLPVPDASLAGLVAWYSIVNLPDEALPVVFGEFHRVLAPGAPVIVSFQTGDEVRVNKDIAFHRRRPEAVAALLVAAGLEPVLQTVREPAEHPGLVEQVPQAYLVARRPSAGH
ncbi:tyrosine-protein phosphatase [Actinoplanes sp. NPDC048967]|uniref:tyrosine-protein phosphatase n=1 Tax=Actinoplanes sp. NPDC048967 TaxID=3155269 RepID=UPI0033E3BC8F